MDFEEAEAKELLRQAGIAVPPGEVCRDAESVVAAAGRLGRSAVKAQVPSGKRGKAGGIRLVKDAAEARRRAGMSEAFLQQLAAYVPEPKGAPARPAQPQRSVPPVEPA